MHAAEQILHPLQAADRAQGACQGQFVGQLERIAQLLRCDPDPVKPVRGVQISGRHDCRLHSVGAPRDPPPELRVPREIWGQHLEIDNLFADPACNLVQVRPLQPTQHGLTADLTLPPDDAADRADGAGESGTGRANLIEVRERDVEFTHAPERTRDASQGPAEAAASWCACPVPLRRIRQQRDRLPQAAGGDAHLVHALHLSRDNARLLSTNGRQPPLKHGADARRGRQRAASRWNGRRGRREIGAWHG